MHTDSRGDFCVKMLGNVFFFGWIDVVTKDVPGLQVQTLSPKGTFSIPGGAKVSEWIHAHDKIKAKMIFGGKKQRTEAGASIDNQAQ